MRKGIFLGFLFSSSILFSQIVGSGYTAPAPVAVAPGQIATFYVAGLTQPYTGITAMLQQGIGGNAAAPIQSVRDVPLCPDVASFLLASCPSLTAVTVQIPYEMITFCALCARPVSLLPPVLEISQGAPTSAFELNPLEDGVHILKQCDVALGPVIPNQLNLTGLPCAPLVTHTDGTLVTAASPANVGEVLTAWVYGLGQTNPAAVTGQTAKAAPAAEQFYLNFDYSINALGTKPFVGDPDRIPLTPQYAGLAPGFVGLYQVNFTVPGQPPNGTPRCAPPGAFAPGANVVQSNLTVSIGGQYSFDGAGICVATQIPVD